MLVVTDRDNTVRIYDSVVEAERDLETIDVANGEYEFCDETGQPYFGDVLTPVTAFGSGEFRIVPRGTRDPSLPASFLSRAADYHSRLPGLKTLQDARACFAAQKI